MGHATEARDVARLAMARSAYGRSSTNSNVARAGRVSKSSFACGPKGVSGYVSHSVPVGIYAALRHPSDMARAVTECISCGGDTDSVAATAGAVIGAAGGMASVPDDLARGILGPWDAAALGALARDCRDFPVPGMRPSKPDPVAPLRSLGFLAVALGHAFHGLGRRALGIPFTA